MLRQWLLCPSLVVALSTIFSLLASIEGEQTGAILDPSAVCFTHVPKAAGSQIGNHVLPSLLRESVPIAGKKGHRSLCRVFAEALLAKHHETVGEEPSALIPDLEETGTLLAVSFRHPVDRVISAFRHANVERSKNHFRCCGLPPSVLRDDVVMSNITKFAKSPGVPNAMTKLLTDLDWTGAGWASAQSTAPQVLRDSLRKAKDMISKSYHLLFIVERWEESLRLAYYLMGLDPNTVRHSDLVMRNSHNNASSSNQGPSESDRKMIEDLNFADMELYQHALKVFNERIRILGEANVLNASDSGTDHGGTSSTSSTMGVSSQQPEKMLSQMSTLDKLPLGNKGWSLLSCNSDSDDSAVRDLTIVSGADSTHYGPELALVLSWLVYAPCARFVALDLGYSPDERALFEKIKKSLPADVRFEIDTFPFDQYPMHYMLKPGKLDSSGRPQGRTYAWKAEALYLTVEKYGGKVLWLDGDSRIFGKLYPIITDILSQRGLLTTRTVGLVGESTHPKMLERFEISKPEITVNNPWGNLNGAIMGFDSQNETIWNTIFLPWLDCARDEFCIQPPGASRANHRQDQSAFSVITCKSKMFADICEKNLHQWKQHQNKVLQAIHFHARLGVVKPEKLAGMTLREKLIRSLWNCVVHGPEMCQSSISEIYECCSPSRKSEVKR